MLKTLFRRHGGRKLVIATIGASAMMVGVAAPAFANQGPTASGERPAQNYMIVQGGSNTTYLMMTALANLFNESPGCDLAAASGSTQPLDYGCPGVNDTGTSQSAGSSGVGEDGFLPFAQENPLNDVVVEEPALGSSNGIKELEYQGGTSGLAPTPGGSNPYVAPLDSARSSRAAKAVSGGDDAGLNFVAYAADAVSWFHWTKVAGADTPSNDVKNLTVAQITDIWSGTLSCKKSGVKYTMNWICLSGGTDAPIALYIAQSGSGTESTWATMADLTGTFPYGGENTSHVIFENETSQIIANGDEADAIFFFSFGKFETTCKASTGECGGAVTPGGAATVALGKINGIAAGKATIYDQLPGSTGTPFPGDRELYNVYSDGSNSAEIPATSAAALNFVSEDGFLCKPSTYTDVDPNTGATYRSEIESTIEAQGFYPLPLGYEAGTLSSIPNPAWNILSGSAYDATTEAASPYSFPTGDQDTDNSAVDGTSWTDPNTGTTGVSFTGSGTAGNPVGYCLVTTTDGDGVGTT